MYYCVTGFMRSGTSAMCHALNEGGLECLRSDVREGFKKQHTDKFYDPNENGLWELPFPIISAGDFEEDNKVVKVVFPWLRFLKKCDRAVMMVREPEEIRQSYEAFTQQFISPAFTRMYGQKIKHATKQLQEIGAEITVVKYRKELLEDPLSVFTKLADAGWPIDPQKSAAIINPSLCRFKSEELIPGI